MINIFIVLLSIVGNTEPPSIILNKKDALVWHTEQEITGEIKGLSAQELTAYHNGKPFHLPLNDDQQFSFQVTLRDQVSKIWIEAPHQDDVIVSDTLYYTLGYRPAPIVKPFAIIDGNLATLQAEVIENPYDLPLRFIWQADSLNPGITPIAQKGGAKAQIQVPHISGTYYYDLLVISEKDTSRFRTMLAREGEDVKAFDMDTEYPRWMDDAVVYQITPYNFVADGTYPDMAAKLPELASLGINTIWLQPVFKSSYRGQGYDVVDYLSLNPVFGTEEELQKLITQAKALGMRVLFDLVLNHTSIEHPYAKEAMAHGRQSHYYDYYQRENNGGPYSSFYNKDENGFIFYFWEDLVNLNYDNEEVQRWMLEVCKHWVRKFGIDGYRFDAIWGVNARMPSFASRLRTELKSIDPEILMLAEDKGADPTVFELGFDAAYDWTADTSWVSQWSWEYEFDHKVSHTIFNYPKANERGGMISKALSDHGANAHRQLRFLENNDLPRFVKAHGLERTQMAAALLFALPGIPMMYNGQEIGFLGHPYGTKEVFYRDSTIQSLDDNGLFTYYRKLINLHKEHAALRSQHMRSLPVANGAMTAFYRWADGEDFIVIINMADTPLEADVDVSQIPLFSQSPSLRFEDVLSDQIFIGKGNASPLKIPMEGYATRWLKLLN